MKAVILAGGRGERLRPITDTRPKPLVPVLARPVMDYCLSLLSHHGVEEAFVTTHYLASQIRHRYGAEAFGMRLSYSQETEPLGTAGGVKVLEENLENEDCFLVMSGDALCDFDLTRAIAFHKEKGADVTIVLSSVKTPLEYGVVLSDTFEKIFAFSEKPDWSETFSDLVNTGVYILSPAVLKKIPKGKPFDFSHDLFPLLLQEGWSLFGYKDAGYWCDIGKIPTLYRCNLDLIQGKAKTYLPPEGKMHASLDGKGKYFVSDGASVAKDAVIQSGSVISPGAHLAPGSRVSGTLVLERAKLEKGAIARDAVLCEDTVIRENGVALPGSVLGAGSVVLPDATLSAKKKYPPFSVVSATSPFQEEGLVFTEKGAGMGEEPGLGARGAEALGAAFAEAFDRNIAIVWDDQKEGSAYFASLFAGGVVSGGKDALLLGPGIVEMASFGAHLYRTPTVFVTEESGRGIFFGFEEDGFPLLRKDTLRLSRFHEEGKKKGGGNVIYKEALREKYVLSLADEMGVSRGMEVGFGGVDSPYLKQAAIKNGFRAYNGTREEGLSLEVFSRGFKIFLDGEKVCDTEKARLFLVERELEEGRRTFYFPNTLPLLFREHVENRGGTVHDFSMDQTSLRETGKRREAEKERWLFDDKHLAARVLGKIKDMSENQIRRAFSATPDIFISHLRYLPKEENKAKILSVAAKEMKGNRNVRIRPGFYGIRIESAALQFEAALENVFECRGKLNEIEKNIGGR